MHRLSIVIPCPVVDERAEDTLVSVLENRPRQCEVIVVTAGKYDDPYDLTGEVKFVEEESDASILRLANAGVEVASADVVHLLLPGAKVVEGWTEEVFEHFDHPFTAAVSPALVRSREDDRALSLGTDYRPSGRRRIVGRRARLNQTRSEDVLAPSLVAGFYRRDVLVALDGFDEAIGAELADVEFGLAIRQLGFRTVPEPTSRVVVGSASTAVKSAFQQGRQIERLYRRYAAPGFLVLLLHTLVCAGDALIRFPRPHLVPRLFGRLTALCERRVRHRQHERIHRAQAYLAQLTASQRAATARREGSKSRAARVPSINKTEHRRAA